MDEHYNCIALTVDDTSRRYWPATEGYYWPQDIRNDESADAFIEFYGLYGYHVCEDSGLETGFEKIAIYIHDGDITHAARQLSSGHWMSKLGRSFEDIEHYTLEGIESPSYGRATVFLRRPRQS
jgi:hypothetical protein